jgi:hypothetical protein
MPIALRRCELMLAGVCCLSVLVVAAALLLAQPVQSQQVDSTQSKQKPIVVSVERVKSGLRYTVDSKPVADLLQSLSILEQERGSNCPVVALLYPKVPIEWIQGIDGIAGKAQLSNVRVFAVFPDARKMSEIRLLPAVPYSTDPAINQDPLGIR